MIRRIGVLLGIGGLGWFLYTRFGRQRQDVYVGDQADLRPEEERGGLTDRVSQAASGVAQAATDAASTAMRAAQVPVEKVRSLVGGTDDEQSVGAEDGAEAEGERAVTPAGPAGENAAEMAAGYVPADQRREPSPPPDAYRPAAQAAPVAAPASPAADGAGAGARVETPASAEPERTIKGNVRSDGDKIYHMPGDPAYERTNAEEFFASAEEAEAAGFRRAGRPRQE